VKRLRRAAVIAAVGGFLFGSRIADWLRWLTDSYPTEQTAWTEADQDAYDQHYQNTRKTK
jgi:hypothetical protein